MKLSKAQIHYLRIYFKVRKFLVYAARWQLSTPVYTIILSVLSTMNTLEATIIANLVGACIFYWIDKFIFGKIN